MLFYVFAYKNTNKHRIPLTFPEEKTKNERKAAAFEQKSIPHPYIKVRMGDVHSRYYFPIKILFSIQDTIFHSRQFTSSFTEKFKPIFTTFLPIILKASA